MEPGAPRRDVFVKNTSASPAGEAAVEGEDDVPGWDPSEESGQVIEADGRAIHVAGVGIVRYEAMAIGAVPGERDEDNISGAARREPHLELLTDRGTCRVLVEEKNRVVFAEGVSKETVESRGVTGTAGEV